MQCVRLGVLTPCSLRAAAAVCALLTGSSQQLGHQHGCLEPQTGMAKSSLGFFISVQCKLHHFGWPGKGELPGQSHCCCKKGFLRTEILWYLKTVMQSQEPALDAPSQHPLLHEHIVQIFCASCSAPSPL